MSVNDNNYNDNYISKFLITQLVFTRNEIGALLGEHHYHHIPKQLKIEITDNLVFEYESIVNNEQHEQYIYELKQIIYKEVKNIEKVESAFAISKESNYETSNM